MTERDKTDFFPPCKSKKTVESLRCDWTVKEKKDEEQNERLRPLETGSG